MDEHVGRSNRSALRRPPGLDHRDAGRVARFTAVTQWLQKHFEEDAAALRG